MSAALHGVSVAVTDDTSGPSGSVLILITDVGASPGLLQVDTLDEAQDVAAHVYNETLRQINELRSNAA